MGLSMVYPKKIPKMWVDFPVIAKFWEGNVLCGVLMGVDC